MEQKAFPVVQAGRMLRPAAATPPLGIPRSGRRLGWEVPQHRRPHPGTVAGGAPVAGTAGTGTESSSINQHPSSQRKARPTARRQAALSNDGSKAKVTCDWVKFQSGNMGHSIYSVWGGPWAVGVRIASSSGKASLAHRPGNSWATPICPPSFAPRWPGSPLPTFG